MTYIFSVIGSLYAPIRSYVDAHVNGKDIEQFGIEPSACAQSLVDNLEKANPKLWYWCGGQVNIIWFNTTFFWHTFLVGSLFLPYSGSYDSLLIKEPNFVLQDSYCTRTFGLDGLKSKLKLA